jgi:hypothetical protein
MSTRVVDVPRERDLVLPGLPKIGSYDEWCQPDGTVTRG